MIDRARPGVFCVTLLFQRRTTADGQVTTVAHPVPIGTGREEAPPEMNTPGRNIIVIGSANMDLVTTMDRVPAAGETVGGNGFSTFPGGKGANQAVGIGKLGGRCIFLGKVGQDAFGERLLESMRSSGVQTDLVTRVPGISTGIAVILVDASGENRIVTIKGANASLLEADVDAAIDMITSASVLLVQLEIPLETVTRAVEIAHNAGVTVILDPAPVPQSGLPDSLLAMIDIVTPNQLEASILTGLPEVESNEDAELACRRLLDKGVGTAVVKLGSGGAVVMTSDRKPIRISGHKVRAIDTTAAGDAFAAALAVGIVDGLDPVQSAMFANAAAALSVQRPGAQSSMPSRAEVDTFLSRLV